MDKRMVGVACLCLGVKTKSALAKLLLQWSHKFKLDNRTELHDPTPPVSSIVTLDGAGTAHPPKLAIGVDAAAGVLVCISMLLTGLQNYGASTIPAEYLRRVKQGIFK